MLQPCPLVAAIVSCILAIINRALYIATGIVVIISPVGLREVLV